MQSDRVATFHRLHESGCFVMPNPWDAGTARALQQLGFPALATTSSGFAWTLGVADNQVPLDQMLEHLRAVARHGYSTRHRRSFRPPTLFDTMID